ncbi:MAG TPA: nucleotidyltransferase family protein [Pyrinomonadaceae bacterium]|nr:nucleotidyltransferase family protein [Pyrinomonadaceae bacterium]
MSNDFQAAISSPTGAYAEGLKFFRGNGMLNDALTKLANDLERNGIDYVVIGAIALNQHGYKRFTEDIDLILSREGLESFKEKLVGLGYRPAFAGAKKKFRTTAENVPIEVIISGEYPGDGLPKPVQFPDPETASVAIDGVKTISLEKLVELKLASGMTAGDRLKDLADVQELIKLKHLDEPFADRLDPFVREKYLELYKAVAAAKKEID